MASLASSPESGPRKRSQLVSNTHALLDWTQLRKAVGYFKVSVRFSSDGQLTMTVMAGGVSLTGTFIRKRCPSAAGT